MKNYFDLAERFLTDLDDVTSKSGMRYEFTQEVLNYLTKGDPKALDQAIYYAKAEWDLYEPGE